MVDFKLPNRIITVIIRDDSPMIYAGDCPSFRVVEIELTDEQLATLELRKTHTVSGKGCYERISRCIIEE